MALSEVEELEMLRLRKQKAMAAGSSPAAAKPLPADVPTAENLAADRRSPVAPPSLTDRIAGAGEAAMGAAASIPSSFIGNVAGAGRELLSGNFGKGLGERTAEKVRGAVQAPFSPKTETGQEYSRNLASAMNESGIAALPPGMNLGGVGQMAPPALRGLREGGQDISGRAGQAMRPTIAPQVAELARKADAYGIPLRPDMLTNNRIMRMVGDALEKVPLSGAKAEARTTAFNKAVMSTIGATGEKLTPDVFAKAINSSGDTIGTLSEKYPIPLVGELPRKLNEISRNAAGFETSDVAKVVNSYISEIRKKSRPSGEIDGETFRKIRTKLTGQMRRTNNGDLKHALDELDDTMLDAIQGRLSPAELDQFNTARRQYANAKTLEPLVAKSPTGDMSPAGLMGRMTATGGGKSAMAKGKAGDLGEIARIGQQFVKEPPTSGTAERSLAYGLLGGSAWASPSVVAPLYAGANAYNRLGPSITRKLINPPGTE